MSVDISKAFTTSSDTISDFFQRPGVGYYIPLYQRPYSWDAENIDQLIADISSGVDALLSDKNNIRFLGTVILVKESNPNENIKPQDKKALPTRIDNVIDGQQRISTIALLACLLYQRLYQTREKLPKNSNYNGLREAVDGYLATLLELFSFDLRRGSPSRKPIIIRGSVDGWTFDGSDDNNYHSEVSSFIASFIRAVTDNSKFPPIPTGSLVGKNLRRMNSLLINVEKAYDSNSDDENFPAAWQILDKIPEVDLWSYERPELVEIVNNSSNPMSGNEKLVCSLVQLFAFCHYLLRRCCFTLNEPAEDDWAFDMFQSLNATGTPLTALETFKPLVVNTVNSKSDQNEGFQGSKSEKYFNLVEQLLAPLSSASSKNKLTNEYLTLFALTHDATKLSTHFSVQRRWLTDTYNKFESIEDKEKFIHRMANVATYWEKVRQFDPNKQLVIPETENVADPDRKEAALCVLYLQQAGHKMANTILSRFYSLIIGKQPTADTEFVFACKAVAAFFTLWRSALSNAGLDEVYRKLLREKMSWEKGNYQLTVAELKTHFVTVLNDKEIGTKEEWKKKAIENLRYNEVKAVCKFALFVTSHDTIADQNNPGLMKIGTSGSSPSYLEPTKWVSEDFKTIEHVAPQKQEKSPGADWDTALYENDDYEKIGNLLLLPTKINSSASNKSWIDKWIYYSHLAETDPSNLAALKNEADINGVDLNDDTIALLQKTQHKHHIIPIVQLGATGQWDKSFVEKRTERICDILWERIYEWLL
ncbi:DUF262 domain-containing protein [Limnofasciculus baicalensis]|uniref:DUF262 domain-containing HNH endonuclease family protein n=1 Tax=Limnofasciculus baicalensis BBK-W-15 TaxID=2699891 RepID=A0AAE3GSE1_9CYAN|nr:DUF262 domain-containing HNH endonuclease family protein [Limnofasciculus baicalensis]MCP2729890.1 DUF262 domain-containing HNH endonuclease family protein [Limnofasciculus baicalensis BBK-W-15]